MAYTTATFLRLDVSPTGQPSIVLRYSGDAGEPIYDFSYVQDLVTFPTADFIRSQAMARLSILNNNKNFVTGATPAIGTILDTTTPLPPPAASTYGNFVAVSAVFTPGTTPQDVFSITGSATRKVTVLQMALSTVQTTAGLNNWTIVKRSTANTGGTSSVVTRVPSDRAFPAATATVLQYTVNPTAGTLVGSIWGGRLFAPTLTTVVPSTEKCVLLAASGSPVVLTGTGDVLAWNFGGAALPSGLAVQASVWWTEQ